MNFHVVEWSGGTVNVGRMTAQQMIQVQDEYEAAQRSRLIDDMEAAGLDPTASGVWQYRGADPLSLRYPVGHPDPGGQHGRAAPVHRRTRPGAGDAGRSLVSGIQL